VELDSDTTILNERARRARRAVGSLALVLLATTGCAELFGPSRSAPGPSSTPDDGVREALRIGAERAADSLGRPGGFLDDPAVRIPIPDTFHAIERALRLVGASAPVDRFVESMNRAAEAAAPVAKDVFRGTVREMTLRDAWTIIRGRSHEATDYLREHAGPRLETLFRPIVQEKLRSVGATRDFDDLMRRAERLPLVQRPAFELDAYVTRKSLDGLFHQIGLEEERIRRDPVARTTALLRRYFGG